MRLEKRIAKWIKRDLWKGMTQKQVEAAVRFLLDYHKAMKNLLILFVITLCLLSCNKSNDVSPAQWSVDVTTEFAWIQYDTVFEPVYRVGTYYINEDVYFISSSKVSMNVTLKRGDEIIESRDVVPFTRDSLKITLY